MESECSKQVLTNDKKVDSAGAEEQASRPAKPPVKLKGKPGSSGSAKPPKEK